VTERICPRTQERPVARGRAADHRAGHVGMSMPLAVRLSGPISTLKGTGR
jgi:hypothetical protein